MTRSVIISSSRTLAKRDFSRFSTRRPSDDIRAWQPLPETPTLANLRQIVKSYARAMAADKKRGDEPVLYFAFSGHGAIDESGAAFLAMTDGALTQDILYDEILAKLPTSYSHLLIDACHAGGVVGVRGGFFDKEVEGNTAAVAPTDVLPILESRRIARFPTVGVLLATTLGEEAHEWSGIESGVFTHELLSGLLGPADVNGDGNVEYTEIQAFVAAANRNIEDPRAIPQIIARPPSVNQNVPLVALGRFEHARLLRGDVGKLGHFFVELENGQRYLDAHVSEGTTASVVLPRKNVAFLRTDSEETRIPTGELVAVGDLRMQERSVASRGSIDASYRSALFSSAYGKPYYQGYVDSIGAVGVRFPEPAADLRLDTAGGAKGNRPVAIGATTVAAASALTSIATAILAFRAKSDFENTALQRPAHEARQRFERYRTISIATGVTAVAAGAIAWWLWPESSARVAPSASGDGNYSISLKFTW